MTGQLTSADLDAVAAIVQVHHKIPTTRDRLVAALRTEADARRPEPIPEPETREDHQP